MYKKFTCLIVSSVLLTGCGINIDKVGFGSKASEAVDEPVITKQITCSTDDSSFDLILGNGQIIRYIDSIDGELGQETVDILNQEHLVGVTDNDEATSIMSAALVDLNGHCE